MPTLRDARVVFIPLPGGERVARVAERRSREACTRGVRGCGRAYSLIPFPLTRRPSLARRPPTSPRRGEVKSGGEAKDGRV
jgi:hypothetical protein